MSTDDVFPNEAGYRHRGDVGECFGFTKRNRNWAGPEGTSRPTMSMDHFIKGYGEDIVDNVWSRLVYHWCVPLALVAF